MPSFKSADNLVTVSPAPINQHSSYFSEFKSSLFDANMRRYILFAIAVAILMRMEIGLLSFVTKVRPVNFNIDYLLIGAGPWQPLILTAAFSVDVLWAVTKGGFFGIADFPILFENAFYAGWGGLAAFVAAILVLILNALIIRSVGKIYLRQRPRTAAVVAIFLAMACGALAIRALGEQWQYRVNSIVGAAAKNIATDKFLRTVMFGAPAHFTYPKGYSLIESMGDLKDTNTLVMVFESWGLDSDGRYRDLVNKNFGPLNPSITSNVFSGPTVYGELRELCGAKTDSLNIIHPPANCVPSRMRDAGLQTIAFHGNPGSFYRRERWFPSIGFDEFLDKSETLNKFPEGNAAVDSFFKAISDAFMLSSIDKVATENPSRKKFYYFMSLSSHGPYGSPRHPERCAGYSASGELCDYYSRIDDTLASLRTFADHHRDFQILVVGDHNPYMLTNKKNLQKFDARHVPAFMIKAAMHP